MMFKNKTKELVTKIIEKVGITLEIEYTFPLIKDSFGDERLVICAYNYQNRKRYLVTYFKKRECDCEIEVFERTVGNANNGKEM